MVQHGSLLISGSADGTVKVWGCDDGTLFYAKREDQTLSNPPPRITALSFIGPLLVAVGTSLGTIVIYDISKKHQLLAVQVRSQKKPCLLYDLCIPPASNTSLLSPLRGFPVQTSDQSMPYLEPCPSQGGLWGGSRSPLAFKMRTKGSLQRMIEREMVERLW